MMKREDGGFQKMKRDSSVSRERPRAWDWRGVDVVDTEYRIRGLSEKSSKCPLAKKSR